MVVLGVAGIVTAVVILSLVCAAVTLVFAIVFTFVDFNDGPAQVKAAAKDAATRTSEQLSENPNQPQAAGVDFGGLAQLAAALDKLNRAGRFLIASIAFAAVAAGAASLGSIASDSPNGQNGPRGATGATGQIGPTGPRGKRGVRGRRGPRSYRVVVIVRSDEP